MRHELYEGCCVSAAGALIDMPAELRGAALRDVGQDTLLGTSQRPDPFESGTMRPHDVRDVKARSAPMGRVHRLPALLRQKIQRTGGLAYELLRHTPVARGRSETGMAEQRAHDAHVGALLE